MKKMILCLIVLLFVSGCNNNGNTTTTTIAQNTFECIGEKSYVYVSTGCSACAKQKEILGENIQYFELIDCKQEPDKCIEDNILRVPTWVIGDEKYTGVKTVEELRALTGC